MSPLFRIDGSFRLRAYGVALGATLLGTGARTTAQNAPLSLPPGAHGVIGERIDRYLTRAAALGFTGQVLAARRGEVLLHRAYGFADRATGTLLTETTPVGVASMTKQFTAAAILELEHEGRLRLTDSIGKYFDHVPEDKRGITIQHLITHTARIRAGVSEDFDMPSLDSSISRLLTLPLTGKVGESWRYASDGYNLLAAIVQRVSGMTYERYMHTRLFEPAGMTHSLLWAEAPAYSEPVAHAYVGWRDRGTPAHWPRDWRMFGSGDLLTTAADLYRWDRALREGKVFDTVTREKYLSPQVPTGLQQDYYGYGLFHDVSVRKTRMIEHGGDTELGFNGAFSRYIDEDAVLIITSNERDPSGRWMRGFVQAEVEAMLFGADTITSAPDVKLVRAEMRDGLAGSYRLDSTSAIHIVNDGAFLWIAADGQAAADLLRPHATNEDSAAYVHANVRTDSLLASLLQRDSLAYVAALGDSGARFRPDYDKEWTELLARYGPLNGYRVIGSVRERNALSVSAQLTFLRGTRTMTFLWGNLGRGRLLNTEPNSVSMFPVILPVAELTDGRLLGFDLWRTQERVRIRVLPSGQLELTRIDGGVERRPIVTRSVSRSMLLP